MRSRRGYSGRDALSVLLATAFVLAVIASIAVPLLPRANAATQTVDIRNSSFTPSTITIAPGDSITWTNNDGVAHTVTGSTGSGWGSGSMASGATYTHQFNTTGDFDYHCSIHTFMTGVVHVTSTPTGPPPTTPNKPLLSGTTLYVLIGVAVVVVAVVAVMVLRKPTKKA